VFVVLGAVAVSMMALPTVAANVLKPDFKAEFNEGGAAAVQVRVTVSPGGVPVGCERAFLNGPASNVDAFCSMLRKQVRFKPAVNASGRPEYGVVYLWSHWSQRRWTGSKVPTWNPVDLALVTNKMPKGSAEGSMFRLMVQVSPRGALETCAVQGSRTPDQVVDLLCREAAAEPILTALNEEGTAISSIQEFIVRLTSAPTLEKLEKRLRRR
jgi:hypothetical protein